MSNKSPSPEFVKIRVDTLNSVINYLCSKPFSEVADLIQQIKVSISTLDATESSDKKEQNTTE